jgi:hypothetical protein
VRLAQLSAVHVPELLICAAVNVKDHESGEGEGCTSFVFSTAFVGGRVLQSEELHSYATDLDCATIVAASGAAVAPNMGRFTRRSIRALMALLNLRLGLWISLPRSQPHAAARPAGQRTTMWMRIADGWHKPGPLWTWREALGDLSAEYKAFFVSDGGHWDNSAIIELMRRRCRTIFAVDASIDDLRLGNLLRAISLARSELGVEINADAELLSSRQAILLLTFTYPGEDKTSPRNVLIVMRTQIEEEMPADIVAMSVGTSTFPRHTTMNQFLHARDVDGYIALGRWLFRQAVTKADLMPVRQSDVGSGV